MRVAVIDYGMGNRRSVQKALERAGVEAPITREHDTLRAVEALVLPGVGAFPKAMENLQALRLDALIRERVESGIPLLGVCLGMQLLFDSSTELGGARGLGILSGTVRELEAGGRRVPHIGWNEVGFTGASRLLAGLPSDGCPFYHVHSYAVHPADSGIVLGRTEYGERFATIVERDTVAGVQFHPEKSSSDGLRLLENFVTAARETVAARVGARAA